MRNYCRSNHRSSTDTTTELQNFDLCSTRKITIKKPTKSGIAAYSTNLSSIMIKNRKRKKLLCEDDDDDDENEDE